MHYFFSDFLGYRGKRSSCLTSFLGFCSYPLAIKFQEQVIDAWEGHGPSAQDELKEAQRLLEQLKKKSQGASSIEPPIRALPSPHNSHVFTRSSQAAVPINEKLSNAT